MSFFSSFCHFLSPFSCVTLAHDGHTGNLLDAIRLLFVQEQEGKWTWADGYPVSKFFWASEQPDDQKHEKDQDCVIHFGEDLGAWRDVWCDRTFKFACQIVV